MSGHCHPRIGRNSPSGKKLGLRVDGARSSDFISRCSAAAVLRVNSPPLVRWVSLFPPAPSPLCDPLLRDHPVAAASGHSLQADMSTSKAGAAPETVPAHTMDEPMGPSKTASALGRLSRKQRRGLIIGGIVVTLCVVGVVVWQVVTRVRAGQQTQPQRQSDWLGWQHTKYLIVLYVLVGVAVVLMAVVLLIRLWDIIPSRKSRVNTTLLEILHFPGRHLVGMA
jgi:hypothetical protein